MSIAHSQRTWQAKPADVEAEWHLVDANGQNLGRMANKIAVLLMGKHKASYTPHIDTGDFVIVTNADKVVVTGKKRKLKEYQTYSGYPSGRNVVNFETQMERNPEKIVRLAVRRMLPKTKLGRKMLGKLKIYVGTEHPHTAQQPKPFEITYGQEAGLKAASKK
jgi:large subunit ribosomal protein L13